MQIHDKDIIKSIDTNIIGTCNLVIACSKLKIKLESLFQVDSEYDEIISRIKPFFETI